jgi:hypothetical protein
MEIIENNGKFEVYENNVLLYVAKSYAEADWFIKWKVRPDAGNPSECFNC